jgi:hypothetical protein
MKSPIFTKSYMAGAAIRARRIVQLGAADNTVIEATASTQVLFGVADVLDTALGDQVDVHHVGTADLLLGGTVARGQRVTADANGAGVAAAPAAGVNAGFVGITLQSGVAGDIIQVLLTPCDVIQG